MEPTTALSELFPGASAPSAERKRSVEDMGSEDFLTLMVAQLKNQDPTKPMDNMQFLAQLAQFGTVSGIQELNAGFSGLSTALTGNQALQAASLVGRSVMVDGNVGTLREVTGADGASAWSLDASVDATTGATDGRVYVQDMSGRLVYTAALPIGSGDSLPISWDGRNQAGELQPPGRYRISAEALINGEATTLPVHATQQVESVAVEAGSGQVTLNLSGGSGVAMESIKQFF